MQNEIFVIYDAKAKLYNKPFYMINKNVALRAAQDLIDDTTTEISKNPQDFTMWHLGTYDDNTAQLTIHEKRECICSFVEINPRLPRYEQMSQEAQDSIKELQTTQESLQNVKQA